MSSTLNDDLKPSQNIVGIVLAAGESRRLGRPKQLVELDGEVLVASAVRRLLEAGCQSVVTVVGAHANEVSSALDGSPTAIVINRDWSQGIGRSIATAIEQLNPNVDLAMISLCDQPLIPVAHFQQLLDTLNTRSVSIAATEYVDGSRGVPAVFDKTHFQSLAQLTRDRGAKSLIRSVDHAVVSLPSEQQVDLDTEADLAQLRSGDAPPPAP